MHFGAFDEDAFVVGDALLNHLFCVTERGRFEFLVAVEIREGRDECGPCGFCYPPQIFFLASPHGYGPFFYELFEDEVVDALCGEDDVGAGFEYQLHTFHHHAGFAFAYLF